MPASLSNQAYVFLCAFLGGMFIAFIYDIFRIRRKAIKTINLLVYIEDLFFWILVSLIMFAVVYYSNEGEVRGYIFLGAILGIIIYLLVFSSIVIRFSIFILNILSRIIKTIVSILVWPFKLLYRIFKRPARFLYRLVLKLAGNVRSSGRSRMAKITIWRKLRKNAKKKI